MTEVLEVLRSPPASPAGRQTVWYLARLHGKGENADLADRDRFTASAGGPLEAAGDDDQVRKYWRGVVDRYGAIQEIELVAVSNLQMEARVLAKDRRWKLTLAVESSHPHRIERLVWERLHDFQLEVREATAADAAILADVERRCPIVLDGARLWFDRGEHYFDFARLMEDCTIGLASVDGAPAAVTCGARHTVRIGGAAQSILTVSHLRVLPEHQRKGLWGEVNRVLDKYWPQVDGSGAYIAVGNAGMQHGFRNTPDKWPTEVLWARLDTARLGGPGFGRSATPDDAPWLVETLNAFHADEEMFVPYTEERLVARLERAADLYSWENVQLTDGAVVGVWPAGPAMRLVTERAGVQSQSQPGVVLDYGFAPGHEAAFESLLRAWCGWLDERGMDRLSIFTSAGSRGVALLRSLADEVEAFNMWTPGVAVPADAEAKGLYVDPIYF